MANQKSEKIKLFQDFIDQTGGTYIFDGESSVNGFGLLFDAIQDMGLNPMVTADLRKGMFSLFNIEIINRPDLENSRFILAPNHVSDLDALILGLLSPNIRIVAKTDWANNGKLRQFMDLHYDLYGLDRTSLQSLRRLLADSVHYFNDSDGSRHFLVFSQGTISDFNNNSPERISTIAKKLSDRTGVPIVNMFIEQASLTQPTRIVFDKPMELSPKDDFPTAWLERELTLQNSLEPPARRPTLSHKHANNNKPGDPFF